MSIFSERLKRLRIANNLIQKDIAKVLDMTVNSYQRYEYGTRSPNLEIVTKISDYYNVPLDFLMGRGFFANWEKILLHKETIIKYLENNFPDIAKLHLKEQNEIALISLLPAIFSKIEISEDNIEFFPTIPMELLNKIM